MKAAVLGKGGREHALALRLAQDLGQDNVWVVPGNAGIPGSTGDVPRERLADELRARGVSLVVVGPEALLAAGYADELRAEGFSVVGPGLAGARLEAEKTYAKEVFVRHRIPTARAAVLDGRGDEALDAFPAGAVVKLDGLAEGKGVIVCDDAAATRVAVADLRARYGADARLLVEERLEGPELSVMLFVSDGEVLVLPESRDHKRLLAGDEGPNTGGMGAFSPVLDPGDPLLGTIARTIVAPLVRGLVADAVPYRGFLYVGLMLTADGPKVLELNARFGDPEAEAVLPRIGGNFAELCLACAEGDLAGRDVTTLPEHCLAVVLAREGYPREPIGDPVALPDDIGPRDGSWVCVANARADGARTVMASGRSLVVVGRGTDSDAAKKAAYERVAALAGPGLVYRDDIGGAR